MLCYIFQNLISLTALDKGDSIVEIIEIGEFSHWQWWVLIGCALTIGISKTGIPNLGTLVAASLAVIFPAKASIGLLLPMLITADLVAVMLYRQSVIWRLLILLMPWVIGGIIIGYLVLQLIDNRQLSAMIGWIVLVLIAVHLVKEPIESTFQVQWVRSPLFTSTLGILAGFTTMVGNAAGGIMAIYFLGKGLQKKEFIGTGAWFYLAVNLIKVPFSVSLGLITADSLLLNAWMIPVIIAGTWIGITVMKRISEQVFQVLVLMLAVIGGVWLLVG